MPDGFVKAAQTDQLPWGKMLLVDVGWSERVLLVNLDGSYHAVSGECTHAFAYLSYGHVYGDEILCPLHGAVFNIKTGASQGPPATEGLTIYQLKVEGNDILIAPPEG